MAEKNVPGETLDVSKLYVWVKSLESKVNNILREVDVLKNDFIKRNNQQAKEIKMMNEEMLELKREQEKNLQKMDLIIKELKQTAGMEEVAVLKKYVDLWNQMHFVTQRDLERVVEAKLQEAESAKSINTPSPFPEKT